MASHSSWAFGRLGNKQALKRAYHFLDAPPNGRKEDGFDFAMKWVRGHDQYQKAKKVQHTAANGA